MTVEVYKTAEEWGLPPPGRECWICGYGLYSGRQKCHGYQEIEPDPDGRTIYERYNPICSICLQVQLVMNKDSLHKDPPPNCWKPIKRIFLCSQNMKRIAVWEVLDHEPWVKQIQKLSPKEGR